MSKTNENSHLNQPFNLNHAAITNQLARQHRSEHFQQWLAHYDHQYEGTHMEFQTQMCNEILAKVKKSKFTIKDVKAFRNDFANYLYNTSNHARSLK